VGGKVSTHNAALPKTQKDKTTKEPKKPKTSIGIVEDSEPERAIGGMEDEDDTLEKQVAMSSPMKGSESRQVGKVRIFPPMKMTRSWLTLVLL